MFFVYVKEINGESELYFNLYKLMWNQVEKGGSLLLKYLQQLNKMPKNYYQKGDRLVLWIIIIIGSHARAKRATLFSTRNAESVLQA